MRIKRAVSFVLSVFTLLFVTVALCACSPREHGFYYLSDEYDNGYITYKEAIKIAKIYSLQTGAYVEEQCEVENIDPKTGSKYEWRELKPDEGMKVPKLSDKEISEIKEAIYVNWEESFKLAAKYDSNENASKEEQIEKYLEFEYCGKYNGGIALAINIKSWMFTCDCTAIIIPSFLRYFCCAYKKIFFIYY